MLDIGLETQLDALLRPFRAHAVPVTSIVGMGWPELTSDDGGGAQGSAVTIVRLGAGGEIGGAGVTRASLPRPVGAVVGPRRYTLEAAARLARELAGGDRGEPALVMSLGVLDPAAGLPAGGLDTRAVAVIAPADHDRDTAAALQALQRALFDGGLVGVGCVRLAGGEARCFLASDAVRSVQGLGAGTRGHIAMSGLGRNGRFGNQLFQYAYVKLYALRHGLTAAVPPWPGQQLFGLVDAPCDGLELSYRHFNGFTDDYRRVWEEGEPPIDLDLWGYFQETPVCWRPHRSLLRCMFQLPVQFRAAIDAWRDEVTRGGRRTLVGIHLRRGDYRDLQRPEAPWFRLVPEAWYLGWLRTLWPTLRDPVLFVASDEPDAVRPFVREFACVTAEFDAPAHGLPDHVRDFEVLRRADYLTVCNSSFCRMAAILADPAQRSFVVSFEGQRFEPYQPWLDPAFWARFAAVAPAGPRALAAAPDEGAAKTLARDSATGLAGTNGGALPAIYFDVSDLLLYVRDHRALSGIQRVVYEIVRHLVDVARGSLRLVVLDTSGCLGVIDASAVQEIVEALRAGPQTRADLGRKLDALFARMVPLFVRPGDVFLAVGAFWGVSGAGRLLHELKSRGVTIGVFVHDILNLTDPEYFAARDTRIFSKGLVEALTFADVLFTTSEYNKAALTAHVASRKGRALPVRVVPLAHEFPLAPRGGTQVSQRVAGLVETDYVLCVGTIEVRKNPTYLFHVWRLMVRSGRKDVPTLVLVGRKGWLVQDFLEQLAACGDLDGRIVVLHEATDVELALLYRRCLLTMFPSLAEGWGLPVGESLAAGKICLASGAGGIPEVGGDLVDYLDPYNVRDGVDRLCQYLDDPGRRAAREREIVERFAARTWRRVADELLEATRAFVRDVAPSPGETMITLPPNQFLPISSDPGSVLLDGLGGELSADLACGSGWGRPQPWGVPVQAPAALLRFRTELAEGTRIHLILRLVSAGEDSWHVRICSGSGGQADVTLKGASTVAVVACAVEAAGRVSARLAAEPQGDGRGAYWGLTGLLYFEPERVGRHGPAPLPASRRARSLPRRAAPTPPVVADAAEASTPPARIHLRQAPGLGEGRRATSLVAFRQSVDVDWPVRLTTLREAPAFADATDERRFRDAQRAQLGAVSDEVRLVRRSDQYVSMSRFSEGSVFDRSGVSRALGYLEGSPPAPWLWRDAAGLWADEAALAAAPHHETSCLVFYNGNLHNYYHWVVEGLLSLDVLARAMGPDADVSILLPTSMDVAAVFDHRRSLRAVGLDGYPVEEVTAGLVRVREAIWVDSDLVQSMPATYLQDFRRRVAARHAGTGGRRHRLLVARRGPTRTIRNFDAVQDVLAAHGFETVYLEGLSVEAQIRLFQAAEFVVSPHGAGLANLLFCPAATKVIELMPSVEVRPFFWLISTKLDLVHGVLLCPPAGADGFQAALDVDLDKLQTLYRKVNARG